jgi:cytoskeletal protein CcmA (bactofilin family)
MTPFRSVYYYGFLIILSVFALSSCNRSEEGDGRKVKRIFLAASEVHDGWYFAGGDQVVIEGTVNGDLYAAGGLVEVSGTVNGDVLAAGGQVIISGAVSDNVRAAGGVIQISGQVGKNISVAGGAIVIDKAAVIGGNLLAASGTIQVGGAIAKEARVSARDMSVSGRINGNVDFKGDNFSSLPGSRIGGNLQASVDKKEHVEITEGTVLGTVDISTPETRTYERILGLRVWRFWFKVLWACSLLLTGFVLLFIYPRQLNGIGTTISQLPGKSLVYGLLGIVLTPLLGIILLITVVGIPLGLLCLCLFLWIVYLSQLSLGVVLGQRLFGQEGGSRWNQFWSFAVGLLIVQALTFVPYLRELVLLAGLIFGYGAILLVLKSMLFSVKAGDVIIRSL